MNLAFFRFCKPSKELILNVITTFFLSYKDHAMDDSNNNIIIWKAGTGMSGKSVSVFLHSRLQYYVQI